ncbi:MAG TPA: hypothetical protein VF733_03570, partial [Candidatus Saccharimonadales bacterium]
MSHETGGQDMPEWAPEVSQGHRHFVETGMFDVLPQKSLYGPEEVVVARHNGVFYQIDDDGGERVRIWYKMSGGERVEEEIPRQNVRLGADVVRLGYQIHYPHLEVEVQGRRVEVYS